jgi:hypothetical protein
MPAVGKRSLRTGCGHGRPGRTPTMPSCLKAAVACGGSGSGPVSGHTLAMSATAAAGATACPCGGRQTGGGQTPVQGGPTAADTSMATESSLSASSGHLPSGRPSFRKQRTVNPPTGPTRYNFLYASSRPALRAACGRPPARQRHDGHWGAGLTGYTRESRTVTTVLTAPRLGALHHGDSTSSAVQTTA